MNTPRARAQSDALLTGETGESPGAGYSALLAAVDRMLDKGLVIDAWARVPVVGIGLLTFDARIYIASWQRYLQLADIMASMPPAALPDLAETTTVDHIDPIAGEPAPAATLERLPDGTSAVDRL